MGQGADLRRVVRNPYPNARRPTWPAAEFIVGNPPFVGKGAFIRTGGWLGVGNDSVYVKSRCFGTFPFPDANNIQKQKIRVKAEELDAHRKRVLAEHPHLTLTGLYNVLQTLRAGTRPDELDEHDRRIFDDGLVLIMKECHDKIDVAVAEAYGWPADLSDDEILARLVALNKQRAEEEKRGLVRWLRPDYQIPRFAKGVDKQAAKEEGAQVAAELFAGRRRARTRGLREGTTSARSESEVLFVQVRPTFRRRPRQDSNLRPAA